MTPKEAELLLPDIRKDESLWNQFSFSPFKDEDGSILDKNSNARYALIIALQYNWSTSDEKLLRFIIQNEVKMHQKDTGLLQSLHISTYLLAKYKNLENVFLFFEAKEANFDTYCGLDVENVFSAGVQKTIEYLKRSNNPVSIRILERVDGSIVDNYLDEERLRAWFEEVSRAYPDTVEKERRITLIDRAITFKEFKAGRILVREWFNEHLNQVYEKGNEYAQKRDLANIVGRAKASGDLSLAIDAQKIALKLCDSPFDRISETQELAELYRLSGSPLKAWTELKKCQPDLEIYKGWNTSGLGRFVITTALQLSLDCDKSSKIKQESFYWANKLISQSRFITLVIFELAFEAASAINDLELQSQYEILRANEKRRIEAMFASLKRRNDSDDNS
ncbi:hypothetical protein [Candidatus Leptofilum sp.]|uniref:hypothetical protein n=1 Tax=Candidatus Leptofilum sp. TaxID=3241576 RepID=UPI003B5CF5A5